jgi:hypothetical protein
VKSFSGRWHAHKLSGVRALDRKQKQHDVILRGLIFDTDAAVRCPAVGLCNDLAAAFYACRAGRTEIPVIIRDDLRHRVQLVLVEHFKQPAP